MPAATFTYDLEDVRPPDSYPARHPAITRDVLAFLEARAVRGTFFVVGKLAQEHPDLVRDIAAAGHEVALHGWEHEPLAETGPEAFAEALARGRAVLEDAAGAPVVGFRAPTFSLTPETLWAVDLLLEAGFRYSSSVLPAHSPLHGFPGAPQRAFRWPNGLLELPCAVAGLGRISLPYLGGVYLRYLPRQVIARLAACLPDDGVPWMYLHAHDFDVEQPFHLMPGYGWMTSRIVYHRRRDTYGRVQMLLDRMGAGPPLAERLDGEFAAAPGV
ncbi:MAG: polysaccharide deacetylase family protein [Solirubrobacteraceae bacterium]